MKEYVHGLFTTEVEINWTSDCTQLYFVWVDPYDFRAYRRNWQLF